MIVLEKLKSLIRKFFLDGDVYYINGSETLLPPLEKEEEAELERERRMLLAVLDIKKKFGKNAILKGMNLEEGATTVQRNSQIGGHRA